jgi:hypothetical protein
MSKSQKKYFLSLQTVFILNENIKYLDEFIKYHISIGFNHFYLYDNEGTSGGNGTKTHNKYGFAVKTINTKSDIVKLNAICRKYEGYITVVKWQPRDKKNNIIYGQKEAIDHFIKTYGEDCEWVSFTDLDEFIVSRNDINIPEYLNKMKNSNVSRIVMTQKKFKDRFLSSKKYITQEFSCIDKEIGKEWGPKNIIYVDDYVGKINIHNIKVNGETIIAEKEDLIFHHYNVNNKQLKWMTGYYKQKKLYKLNSIDNTLDKCKYLFEEEKRKYLLFTSVGDNTDFHNRWCSENRNYDIIAYYYGNSDDNYNLYKNKVDVLLRKKGYKWPLLLEYYRNNKSVFENYERYFIVDDDIVLTTNEINSLFDISDKYNLSICGPAFSKKGKYAKLAPPKENTVLRYTNWIENNAPIFNYTALTNFLKVYDGSIKGWGVDHLYLWVNGKYKENKNIAIIDEIVAINPKDNNKILGKREWNVKNEYQDWIKLKKKLNIGNFTGDKIFGEIVKTHHQHN